MTEPKRKIWKLAISALLLCSVLGWVTRAQGQRAEASLAAQLRSLDSNVLSADERTTFARMLRRDLQTRQAAVHQRDAEAWANVKSSGDWEKFYAPRIEALRRALGVFPPQPKNLNARVTRAITGDGFRVENIVYESRPGVIVTANLYLPSPARDKMPAIIIVHSHHNPKTQGELQDMGMTWARQGCAVLVMDQFSYGERRQHASGPRQDYRFRYINGLQLYVIGDSLMGWMVWDVMRGLDMLLRHPGVDKETVMLIGSVAGGGDPAAVIAALDKRIASVSPFNFGGPEPETPYPLPEDAEKTFNYMGTGSWESTRSLRLSGRDGFLPWVIVASVAPRRLIYAHEFSWDAERDPVWRRLQKVFGLYNASGNLAFTHGRGVLTGQPPDATHCNNVGSVHRTMIHAAFARWFGIPIPAEFEQRRPAEELACITPEVTGSGTARRAPTRPLHELFAEIGASRATAMRANLRGLKPDRQRQRLRHEWVKLLGDIEPKAVPLVKSVSTSATSQGISIERILVEVEPHVVVPTLLLLPPRTGKTKAPVAFALSQDGKGKFLTEHAEAMAEFLTRGVALCIPDLRGTGETRPEGLRQYQSEATSISATELMLGQTLLGSRLRDLRSVMLYLRTRADLDANRVALWGDSFAPVNRSNFADPPIGEGEPPSHSEPLGGLLALFGALYEDGVRAIVARGTLAGYQSVLRDRFCYVPHDAVVPGALTAGDLCDIAAALAPRPLRLEALVDGRNCLLADEEAQRLFGPALQAYRESKDNLVIRQTSGDDIAAWLANSLTNP